MLWFACCAAAGNEAGTDLVHVGHSVIGHFENGFIHLPDNRCRVSVSN